MAAPTMDAKDLFVDLDNVKNKLNPLDPNAPNHLWAIVDMGSNGVRFSITDLTPPATRLLRPLYSDRAGISIFDALDIKSEDEMYIPKETIDDVSDAVGRFNQIAEDFGVPVKQRMVMATEAMRKARNNGEMLIALNKKAPGVSVNILDGHVETLCGAVMGSRSGLVDVKDGALFMDLGGGSVQLTWVETGLEDYEIQAAMYGQSLPYGAAKLKQVIDEDLKKSGKKKHEEIMSIKGLDEGLSNAYGQLCSQFIKLHNIRQAYENGDKHAKVKVYMCGGGFRGYGSMLMHNDDTSPYPIPSTNGYTAPGKLFYKVDKMREVNDEYDGKIFGLSKRRRQQFDAIAVVINAITKVIPNIDSVTFCGGSNRQGALMMKMPKEVRESNPLDALAFSSDHEKEVLTAVSGLLEQALPEGFDFSETPTIFNQHLGPLFAKDIWGRAGYDGDGNTAQALSHAIHRDSEVPGLSHLGRALLGLTSSARWGGNLGPMDAKLFQGLTDLVENQGEYSPGFWAGYIGAVANLIATVVPVFPKSAHEVSSAFEISARIKGDEKKDKKREIVLHVGIKPGYGKGIDVKELGENIEETAKKRGAKKAKFTVTTEIKHL